MAKKADEASLVFACVFRSQKHPKVICKFKAQRAVCDEE